MDIANTVQILKKGGVIAFPTETSYGLGCDPRNRAAVRRIFRLKGRDPRKPLLLVASSLAQVRKVVRLNATSRFLSARHWPGPLTLILDAKKPTLLVAGVVVRGEVAIRVSSSPIVQRLCRQFRFPIVATSANVSGEPVCRSAHAVRRTFGNRLDSVVDAGSLPKRKPSTVARVKKGGLVEVIRPGAVRLPPYRFLL